MHVWRQQGCKISGISQISVISVLLRYAEFGEHGLD